MPLDKLHIPVFDICATISVSAKLKVLVCTRNTVHIIILLHVQYIAYTYTRSLQTEANHFVQYIQITMISGISIPFVL